MNISSLCRSCMKETCSSETNDYNRSLMEMFTFCTMIEVSETDILPKNFCSDCTTLLQSSYNYIKKALDTNEAFKAFIIETKLKYNDSESLRDEIIDNNTEKVNLFRIEKDQSRGDFNVSEDWPKISNCENESERNNIIIHEGNQDIVLNIKHEIIDNSPYSDIKESIIETTEEGIPEKIESENVKKRNKCKDLNTTKTKVNYNFRARNFSSEKEIISELHEHMTDIEIKQINSKNTCHICFKVFKGVRWLNKHIRHHCLVTNLEKLKSKSDTKEILLKTNEEQDKTCNYCQIVFTSKAWYDKHMDRHSANNGPLYNCAKCSISFEKRDQLRNHRLNKCQTLLYTCPVCDKTFRMRKYLSVHLVSHSSEKHFICDTCNKGFKLKHILISHLKVHERKAFLCSECGKNFTTASGLEEHLVVHSGARPYSCSQCPYRTGFRCTLRQHELRHTKHKPYTCPHCQKSFYESGGLQRHVRTHTGERPFKCPSCPLGFVDGWKRKVHLMRVHQYSLEEIPKLTRDGRPFE